VRRSLMVSAATAWLLHLSAVAVGQTYSCPIQSNAACYSPPTSSCREIDYVKMVGIDLDDQRIRFCFQSGCDSHDIKEIRELRSGHLELYTSNGVLVRVNTATGEYGHAAASSVVVRVAFGRCYAER